MSDDSPIGPRYALLVPGWLKWFGGIFLAFMLGVYVVVSVVILAEGNLWGLLPLLIATYVGWVSLPAFRGFYDPPAGYIELADDRLIVRPVFSLGGPLNVPYPEIESVRISGDCGWSLLQYPYASPGAHIDVRLTRMRLIIGRSFRLAKTLHLKVAEPEAILSELNARRTGR